MLLKVEAFNAIAWDLSPADAVAVPVAGRANGPRNVLAPTTSSAVAGADVLMPIFAVGDAPDWKTAELPIVAAPVKSGKKPAVPAPVMVATAGVTVLLSAALFALATLAAGVASIKAEGGNPPMVSASCAFKA